MLIGHSSDLHGQIHKILENYKSAQSLGEFDLWIDSGDFFPNKTRGNVKIEVPFQREWFAKIVPEIIEWLDGKPVVSVSGNHDFVNLALELNAHGYENAYMVTPEGIEVNGIKFAGYPNINRIMGEWNNETHYSDFDPIVNETFDSDPQILVTHAPPASILDFPYYGNSCGVQALLRAFTYRKHRISHHLFGHCHSGLGQRQEMGVSFHNGATSFSLIKL